ncbi:hypothetical protein SETIT_5G240400v2 [Setaria italica]|uniref:CASP-like protein n=1 Tax=Setaria italica TaxID=4555 RepID=A0A368R9W2_SETIT|nr:CASP-like protein 4U1 [Setaria italica]RCV26370.1 hypothetical protein SETIT_5G240400v2 [Setaria italica]
MPSTPRTPAPERPPPPVPAPAPPPPLETPLSPSPSSQPGEEYHTPPPSLDASPREQASFPSDGRGGGTPTRSPSFDASPREEACLPSDGKGWAPARSPPLDASPREQASFPSDGRGGGTPTRSPSLDASPREQASFPSDGRGGGMPTRSPSLDASPREQASLPRDGRGGAPAKSPPLSPVRLPTPHLLPPPASPSAKNGQEGGAAGAAAPARPQLRLATGLLRTPSQGSLATKSPSPSPSPTPPSPLTPAPAANINNKSGQSTPKQRAETWKPPLSPAAAPAIAVPHFDPAEEAVTSPLRLGKPQLDHRQQQRQQHAAAENGGSVPPDVAAVAAVGERRPLSVTLRLATAALSLAAFSVIASARTSGWAGDSYARHQQYRYAVAVNVIVCAYSIAQSFGEIRRLISPTFIFRSRPSYYCSLFLDQVLAYLLMSASSAAASRNDLWVSRFGTDAFNRKISSALWLSFIGFLMLALNALISTANLFSMV